MHTWIFAGIITFIGILNFVPPFDTDLGWHYRCGAELLQGSPCLSNTFSYYLPDYHAYYSSFISDALTAIIFDAFGLTGLSILHSILIALTGLLFIKYTKLHAVIGLALFLTANALSWPIISIGWRPQILSYLFIFWLYISLIEYINNKEAKSIYLIPFVIAFWVNTHMGFFTGILLLLFGSLQEVYVILSSRSSIAARHYFLPLITALSIMTTSINPFGWHVYLEIFRHFQSPLDEMIAEWTPPAFFHRIIILFLMGIFIFLTLRQKKLKLFSLLTLIFFAYASFTARRNLPIYYTLAFFEIALFIPKIHLSWLKNNAIIIAPLTAAIIIATSFISIKKTMNINLNWTHYCHSTMTNFPCEVLDRYPDLQGNIFTAYEYGGFLIWQRPHAKIFIDGRMPAWSDDEGISPYQRYLAIVQTQYGWNEMLTTQNTHALLLNKGTFLELLLRKKSKELGWQKEYENQWHVFYRKSLK